MLAEEGPLRIGDGNNATVSDGPEWGFMSGKAGDNSKGASVASERGLEVGLSLGVFSKSNE